MEEFTSHESMELSNSNSVHDEMFSCESETMAGPLSPSKRSVSVQTDNYVVSCFHISSVLDSINCNGGNCDIINVCNQKFLCFKLYL